MKRKKSHFEGKEAILERFIQKIRAVKVAKHIKNGSTVLDLGCGYQGSFLRYISGKISKGVGIDISVSKKPIAKIRLVTGRVDASLPVREKFDYVVSMAVVEHVDKPETHFKEAIKHLNNGGTFLLTTPSQKAKPILEFLSFKLGLVSRDEISDHKRYFTKEKLIRSLRQAGFRNISVIHFELGMNLFAVAKKSK